MNTISSVEVQAIIDTIKCHDFSVSLYDEKGIICGAEIENWTEGGVDMIHFIDLRGKDINDPDAWKEEIAAIAAGFNVDEEIDVHRQDKRYRDSFTCRASVQDFEAWQECLRRLAQAVLYPEIENEKPEIVEEA